MPANTTGTSTIATKTTPNFVFLPSRLSLPLLNFNSNNDTGNNPITSSHTRLNICDTTFRSSDALAYSSIPNARKARMET
jgi:hypothetical protein